jgi:hypothetical protein
MAILNIVELKKKLIILITLPENHPLGHTLGSEICFFIFMVLEMFVNIVTVKEKFSNVFMNKNTP